MYSRWRLMHAIDPWCILYILSLPMYATFVINWWCIARILSSDDASPPLYRWTFYILSICYAFDNCFDKTCSKYATTDIVLSALCDSPSALRNRLMPSVCLIIRWRISYTCYMLLDTCLLSSYWSMLHALHDIDRHATVYMLSRMYVLRVRWSMYDMLQIYDSLYTCKSMCAINLCMFSVQHTYGPYYQLYCILHIYRSLIHVMHCWCILRGCQSIQPDRHRINEWCMLVMLSIYDTGSTCDRSIMN